jgi:hypothetical protein
MDPKYVVIQIANFSRCTSGFFRTADSLFYLGLLGARMMRSAFLFIFLRGLNLIAVLIHFRTG